VINWSKNDWGRSVDAWNGIASLVPGSAGRRTNHGRVPCTIRISVTSNLFGS
jgi:hypothetical protein